MSTENERVQVPDQASWLPSSPVTLNRLASLERRLSEIEMAEFERQRKPPASIEDVERITGVNSLILSRRIEALESRLPRDVEPAVAIRTVDLSARIARLERRLPFDVGARMDNLEGQVIEKLGEIVGHNERTKETAREVREAVEELGKKVSERLDSQDAKIQKLEKDVYLEDAGVEQEGRVFSFFRNGEELKLEGGWQRKPADHQESQNQERKELTDLGETLQAERRRNGIEPTTRLKRNFLYPGISTVRSDELDALEIERDQLAFGLKAAEATIVKQNQALERYRRMRDITLNNLDRWIPATTIIGPNAAASVRVSELRSFRHNTERLRGL